MSGEALLKARVRTVPAEGKANAALVSLMAERLGVSASSVTVERGTAARVKSLAITGNLELLDQRLRTLLADLG